ncbi:MAG: hypothetical protein ACXW2A_15475 [Burkholderiales bacterium]
MSALRYSQRVLRHSRVIMLCVAIACGTAVYGAETESIARRSPQAVAPEATPAPPAFPFRYLGSIEGGWFPKTIALTRGSHMYVISVGDMIGASYRLESVSSDHLTVTYLPLKQRQTIALSSIPPDRPAAVAPAAPKPAPATSLGTPAPTCC